MKKPIPLFCLLLGLALAPKAQSPADSLAALLPGMDERQRADFINEHFYTFYSNNYDQAVALVEQALSIAERQNMPSVKALTLKNIGVVHYLKGDYEKALTHYQRSLDLYESQRTSWARATCCGKWPTISRRRDSTTKHW